MSVVYDLFRLAVLTAQQIRSSDGEDHTPDCTHPACVEERSARREMEDLPEHKEDQSSWVSFMNELREAARKDNDPIIEDDELTAYTMYAGRVTV